MAIAGFDRVADVYDKTIPLHIRDHYLEKRFDFIKGILIKGTVLDIGCGTGILDYKLEENGFTVVGLDLSREMLKEAVRRGCSREICATAVNLPFKSESFDLVVSIVTLHHLADGQIIYAALQEMLRVAKQDGAVLIWDHNPLNPYWSFFMKRLPQDAGVERTIPLSEIIQDFKRTGEFRITVKKLGLVPDFVPKFLLGMCKGMEKIIENLPLLNNFCAHNVVLVRKG